MTASEYAKSLNDPFRGKGCLLLVEDQGFWEEIGVSSGEELRRHLAISEYEDSYKETRGFRPRRSWDGVPTEDIEQAVKELFDSLD